MFKFPLRGELEDLFASDNATLIVTMLTTNL
jgi:hypothetical protein